MNEAQTILDVEWVLVEEEVPTMALVGTPTTPDASEKPQERDLTRTEALLLLGAYIATVFTVALSLSLANYLDKAGLTVFLLVALVGAGVLVVALPVEDYEPEHVAMCTPGRITFTGR